ncbi:hypothetical protein T484DRAFT_1805787 [Baffinella frigidus]|nr:hypothetical protein T484DRAFT_1805787 [Cryptophyta sp. CCMP2293]
MMERRGSKDSITARRRSIFGKHGGRSREHGGSSRSSRPECAAATVRLSLALPLLCLLSLGGADAAFTSSSLAFAPAQVGVGSEMSVSFTSDAAFSLGDIVSIVLPSFGEGRGSFSPTVVSEQPFRTASWNAGTETLSFTSRGSIAANKACRIMIPQDQAIHLPSSGIRVGATGLTITSGGVSGNIGTVPAVGSFRTSTSLSFSPRYTVAPVAIAVSSTPKFDVAPVAIAIGSTPECDVAPVAIAIGFTPECDVATSELITFTLPG